ncbi:L-rhamnose mutarotase [Mangrovibacterium diazotrophicum]|uniref:L-rhamnose mutarotase n=2 Tax=Mangrovibacterium diazotrophicum TaxID=1261403 RepID=A0A419W333_9BACT|nr:L-rhamnose mutarotase [Mangrovibacterium diazotrophicum]
MKFKRYCKTLMLQNDPQLIEAYLAVHAKGNTWPEIGQGMKEVGILDMEIYRHENRLFMIMDTVADFDHDKAMAELATKPRQGEWEAFVSRFQVTSESATADEKWQLMERIYELDQQEDYKAEDGQQKEI